MKSRQHLAIIGSGASAIYLLKHLWNSLDEVVDWLDTISIFEKSRLTGMGMPYSPLTTDRYHLSNISSEEIPLLTESFADWLGQQSDSTLESLELAGVTIDEKQIYSRLSLGCYLNSQYHSIASLLAHAGIRIDEHSGCAVRDLLDLPEEDQVELTTAEGERIRFDKVIVATGHFWPDEDVPEAGYYASPWPIAKLLPGSDESFNHTVGTLGASLSAFDVVTSLAHRHGRFVRDSNGLTFEADPAAADFRIVMHSAEGLLPHLQYEQVEPLREIYRHVDREALLALIDSSGFLKLDAYFDKVCRPVLIRSLGKDGLEGVARKLDDPEFGWEDFVEELSARHSYPDPFSGMQDEFQQAKDSVLNERPIHWKESLDDLIYTINFHAELLSAEDHRRLHSLILPFLMNIVAALPLESAEILLALHAAGRLELVEGKVQGVHHHPENRSTAVEVDSPDGMCRRDYQTFVDCSGQQPVKSDEYPFPSLVRHGTVRPARARFENPLEVEDSIDDEDQSRVMDDCGALAFQVGGVDVDPAGRLIASNGVPNPRIYDVAFPHTSGIRPYSYGLQACNETASITIRAMVRSE